MTITFSTHTHNLICMSVPVLIHLKFQQYHDTTIKWKRRRKENIRILLYIVSIILSVPDTVPNIMEIDKIYIITANRSVSFPVSSLDFIKTISELASVAALFNTY